MEEIKLRPQEGEGCWDEGEEGGTPHTSLSSTGYEAGVTSTHSIYPYYLLNRFCLTYLSITHACKYHNNEQAVTAQIEGSLDITRSRELGRRMMDYDRRRTIGQRWTRWFQKALATGLRPVYSCFPAPLTSFFLSFFLSFLFTYQLVFRPSHTVRVTVQHWVTWRTAQITTST